jgi:tetratricopeptide (TPR) repeat protein
MDQEKLRQAQELRISGQYDDAVALFEGVLAEAPDCADAWWGLAHCTFNHLGDFDGAQAQFEKATQLEPANTRYLYDLAMYFTMLGMDEDAKPVFERILETDPGAKEAGEARKQLSYFR